MPTITIPRLTEYEDFLKAGNPGWIACQDGEGKTLKPAVVCNCGERFGLRNHHVHSDGRVTESFYCKDGCGWHVYLILDGWTGEDFPPGQ